MKTRKEIYDELKIAQSNFKLSVAEHSKNKTQESVKKVIKDLKKYNDMSIKMWECNLIK